MIHRLLLNALPTTETGGTAIIAPAADIVIRPSGQTDNSTKNVKVQTRDQKPPSALDKSKGFDLDLDDPTIAETFNLPKQEKTVLEKAGDVIKEGEKADAKKVAAEKPKEGPKKEVVKEAPKTEVKPAAGIKPLVDITKADPKPLQRDYAAYPKEVADVLKQMSNPAYEFTTKLMKDNKELQMNKVDSIYQHPDAYILTPEFRELQQKAFLISKERQVYEQQILDIRAGKDWRPLLGFDPKSNEPVLGAPQKAVDRDELAAQNRYNLAQQLYGQTEGQVSQITQQFGARHKTDVEAIHAERAKRFQWVSDPKLLEHKINIPEVGDVSIKQLREDFLAILPAYRRSDPLAETAADLFVVVQAVSQKLREAETQKEVAVVKHEEVLRAEPNSTSTGATESEKKKKNDFDMNDFPID